MNNVIPLQTRRRSPVPVYLESLAPSGRRSMESYLRLSLRLLRPRSKIESFNWASLRYEDLVKVRFLLLNEGKSIHTVNTALAALKGVLKTAFNMGAINADQMLRVTAVKSVRGQTLPRGRALSPMEARKLLEVYRGKRDLASRRNYALLYTLIDTGIRRDEAANLKVRDFCLDDRTLRVRCGKGYRQRVVTMSKRGASAIQRWIMAACLGQRSALFMRVFKGGGVAAKGLSSHGIYGVVRQAAKEAGVRSCTPHDMRRSYITNRLKKGADLGTVSREAGHQDLQTTLIYDRR